MKYFIVLCFLVGLVGCSKEGTTKHHIAAAQELCSSNEGINVITNATYSSELEGCGYRCSRSTGRTIFKGEVQCNNGAKFEMSQVK